MSATCEASTETASSTCSTKTIFDETKLSVVAAAPKTTTNGINRRFRRESMRQNCAIRDPLSRRHQDESRSARGLFGARLHPAFEDYCCCYRVDCRLARAFLYRHPFETLFGFEACQTLVEHLETTFGSQVGDLRLHLDGCPHACAQHWVGDLGFQATTGKDDDGNRVSAYDIFVRGSLGPAPAIGGSLFRRVSSERLEPAVEGLVRGWLDGRGDGETFTDFQRRLTDDELGVLAGLEPARKRVAA